MRLEPGQSHVLKINPAIKWQDTQLDIRNGDSYKFTTEGYWIDLFIFTDADGFHGKWIMPKAENKRAPEFKWLALMGSLNENETAYFLIGKTSEKTFDKDGRLSCFANDMKNGGFYLKNNWGRVRLTITRIK